MRQVMIALSVKDYRALSKLYRMEKRSLNPGARRRIGSRGRSKVLREFMLYGFEQASKDPQAYLKWVRDTKDPLIGTKGRKLARSAGRSLCPRGSPPSLAPSTRSSEESGST